MTPSRIRFGLIPVVPETVTLKRTILPLKAVQCRFTVHGGLVEVEMTQVYRQENEQALDCRYLFPLPADAAVYRCEAFINDRVIRAKVEEREAAKKLAEEKKSQGYRTTLVEAERDNLFTLTLTNLQPEDLVEVTLSYIQPLRHLAGRPSVEIPLCPGIRYIPGSPLLRSNKGKGIVDDTDQVPDASRISPPRVDAEHPDAAVIDVEGLVEAECVQTESLVSPSHQIVSAVKDGSLQVRLASRSEVPDQDFVLRWQELQPDQVKPRAWTCDCPDGEYALLEIRAPGPAPTASAPPQDVYFLVDRSGSMDGEKWQKAVQALQSCVAVLGKEDRVMITLFASDHRDFAEQPLPVQQIEADKNYGRLEAIGADEGTELVPALRHVLDVVQRHSANRRCNLVLITDAQVGNKAGILGLAKSGPQIPVHCFGIDQQLNDALLLDLAEIHGGTFHSLNPKDDIAEVVRELGRTLRQPVLVDLELVGGWEVGGGRIPGLYAGQVCYLAARHANAGQPVTLTGRDANRTQVLLEFTRMTGTHRAAYLQWAKQRLRRLLSEERTAEAVALSTAANLICPLTAFVAWDEQEQVAVADHDLHQPSLLSEAVNYCLAPAVMLPPERLAGLAGPSLYREFGGAQPLC